MDELEVDVNDPNSIRRVCQKYGFFYVPMDETAIQLIDSIIQSMKAFFQQSTQEKMAYFRNNEGIGYSPFKSVNDQTKESFSFQSNQIDSKYTHLYESYMTHMNKIANKIFLQILKSLDIDPQKYQKTISPSFDTLTLLHYPLPLKKETIGFAPHTDWGFLTLLQTTAEGLQININNEWIDIPVKKDRWIVNLGYMMEILSAGEYRATLHQVSTKVEKYSIAFFFEPHLESTIEPYQDNSKYQAIRFIDYFKSQLNEESIY